MKKIFAILLAVILMFSLSATAFAAEAEPVEEEENFVNSAANAGTPEVLSIVDANGNDVTTLIKITSFLDREELDEGTAQDMVDAYHAIKNAEDLAALNDELKEAAGDKKIAVSDLFDVSAVADVAFPLTVKIKSSNLDNFIALLHFVKDGFKWVDAQVEGDELSFTLQEEDGLSPFAIVVAAEPATSAQTGETASIGLIAAAVVFAIAAGFFFTKSLKVKA